MPDPGKPGEIRAAGAVLWRPGPTGPEVALVHRPRYNDWAFPKGKRLPGEHLLVTAVREVAEETGITVVLGRRLSQSRYLSNGHPKRVDYWAGRGGAQRRGRPAGVAGGAGRRSAAQLPARCPAAQRFRVRPTRVYRVHPAPARRVAEQEGVAGRRSRR